MANETIGGIKRLSDQIGGDDRWDVEITGGSISNVTLTDVTLNGVETARSETIVTAAGDYTVQPDDYVVTINKTVPEVTTVTLPASPSTSRSIIVKDGQGEAATYNITIDGNGQTIDSEAAIVLSVPWQAREIIFNGTEWNIISSYKDASAGDVIGAASSTDNAVARFDGTTGRVIQNSTVTIADTTGVISGTQGINVAGSSSGQTLLQATAAASGTITLPSATDTLVGKSTTDTLTNKTFDTAGTGNSFSINGVAVTANTGTGDVVRQAAPTLTGDVVVDAIKTSGSSGVVLKNSAGTTAASFGIAGTTNGDVVGGFNVGGALGVTGVITASNLTASQAIHTNASKQLVSVANTGTGNNVLATSPTLVTPALGTPSSGTLTSCTGLPVSTGISGLGTGVATFLATPSSANLAAAVTGETGSGALVFATSPTLVTPVLGVATATSVNKVAITAPATSATLTVANGKTLTASNTVTITATDGSTLAVGSGASLSALGSLTPAASKVGYYTGASTAALADLVPAPTSWTPTDGSGAGLSFTSVVCRYTVIGDTVTVWLRLNYPATPSGAEATINGLPFASVGENIGVLHTSSAGSSGVLYTADSGSLKILGRDSLTFRTNANMASQPLYGYICYRKA